MSRTQRLFDLIQILRQHRRPVSGAVLAEQAGVSLRTIYRDIENLRAQGADIDGEAGIGYVLKPGFLMPPLMFDEDEIEALTLGSRWVARNADPALAQAAGKALTRIAAVLPPDLKQKLELNGLVVAQMTSAVQGVVDVADVRKAIRDEVAVRISYSDAKGDLSERTIWPIMLGFFEKARIVAAWCELREDFRNFRTDRIHAMERTSKRYPRRRAVLMKEWKHSQGLAVD